MAQIEVDVPEAFAEFGGIPDRVDRYRIVGTLGTGSMGVVLRAHDPALGRDVALKLVRLEVPHRTDMTPAQSRGIAKARFVHEARIMARFAHPNIVPIYDVGVFGDHLFLSMELVEGETLDQWLSQPRDHREIVGAFLQAADGLAAAHRAGLVHRDFKPGNVLIARDGTVKVMDFGLATFAGSADSASVDESSGPISVSGDSASLTQIGMSVGTPTYMAPEQHYGQILDGRADQYALCCALFEALYGQVPFKGDDPDALLRAKMRKRPDRVRAAGVPRWLDRVVCKGLCASPNDRYDSVDELIAALRRDDRRRLVRRSVFALAMLAVLGGAAVPIIAVGSGALPRLRHAQKPDSTPTKVERKLDAQRSYPSDDVGARPSV